MTRLSDPERLGRKPPLQANCIGLWTSVVRARADILRLLTAVAAATFCLALSTSGATPATPIASRRSSSSFDFSYVVRVSPPPGKHDVRVWIPLPSTDEFQTISEVHLEAPAKVRMRTEMKDGNQFACITVNPSRIPSPFEIRLTFHAVRYERRLDLASAIDPPGPFPKDVAAFLQPDKLVPIDGAIASVTREQTQGLASPIEKARRIYEYVVQTMRHDREGTGACRDDCTDLHSLFIAMARAAGIPARLDIGFLLPEGQKEGIVPGYHSWAEFYVNGIGWIPVDAAQASQGPNMRDDFFGAIDAHRVMVSMGRGIGVMLASEARPSDYMVYPHIEMDGKASPDYSVDFFFDEARFASATPSLTRKPIFAGGRWMAGGRFPRFPS